MFTFKIKIEGRWERARMRFLADSMLAKLARWLRILGYDTVCATDIPMDDSYLLIISKEQDRVLLTKDKELIRRAHEMGLNAFHIHGDSVEEQIAHLLREGIIDVRSGPSVERCPLCNGTLAQASRKDVRFRVPEMVYREHSTYWVCTNCGQIYWEGSHWKRIRETIERVKTMVK